MVGVITVVGPEFIPSDGAGILRNSPMTEATPDSTQHFWTRTPDTVCAELRCSRDGLSAQDAEARLGRYGPNADAVAKRTSFFGAIARRLLEPLSLILLAAGIVSAVTGDTIGGSIIVMILAFSIGLDTIQEGHAVKAAEVLRRSVALKAEVKRDGSFRSVAVEAVVPGDILRIKAGESFLPMRFCWKARLSRLARPP